MRILLVEDHRDSADMLALVLRGNEHDVLAVGTAAEALRACGEGAFDLIVSDIGLPDFNGWELLGRVRENCATPAIAPDGLRVARGPGAEPGGRLRRTLRQAGEFPDVHRGRRQLRPGRVLTPGRSLVPPADVGAWSSDPQIIFEYSDCEVGSRL